MRQISSKFNMYLARVGVINNNIERLVLHIIFWSFGALALLYVLFLGNMVRNIVERKSLEVQVRSLSGEVGDLEVTYLSMVNNIDLDLSHSMGFKETKASFATRKALGFNYAGSDSGSVKIAQNDL